MDAIKRINSAQSLDELELLRQEFFGKKGYFAQKFETLKGLQAEQKKHYAADLNKEKQEIFDAIGSKKLSLEAAAIEAEIKAERIDVSAVFKHSQGSLHPINIALEEIIDYFYGMNFAIKDGPLIEDEFHNFEALNLPEYHPAREMQDTFYLQGGKLLRTQTSPIQIRTMLSQKPPLKIIAPGAVFRRDYDLTHTPMFHQVEGLVVDDEGKVSFANLKFILQDFLRHFFGDVRVRFRPSFFPFTEPSAEADISCIFCHGDGCRVCSHTGWLEVLGCGVVDPNVFKAVGYEKKSGYAFGLGVERFAMLKFGISDLRALFECDLDLLGQFS